MHQYDQFKQDMEKMNSADLNNPIRSANRSKPEATNLFQYDRQQLIPNCTVITLDGLDGFMWIGPDGVRHNEGLRWPTMRIEQGCTVEVLTDEYGRESKGWYKDNGTERTD